jgi:triosephosphate isomerase
MRNKFIAGNWKMNTTPAETVALLQALIQKTTYVEKTTIMVAPPFTNLSAAEEVIRNSKIKLGAQNLFWEEKGAYTGEISASMLQNVGCSYVIIGHSERRQYFKETDEDVNRKIHAALKHGLFPVICFGETLNQRESGQAMNVVEKQVRSSLANFTISQAAQFTLAYEPVWAIGSGKAASPSDATEMHSRIRTILRELFDGATAETIRIQYGGSVTPDNISAFIPEEQIDGALVGGACLKAESFSKIIEAAEAV